MEVLDSAANDAVRLLADASSAIQPGSAPAVGNGYLLAIEHIEKRRRLLREALARNDMIAARSSALSITPTALDLDQAGVSIAPHSQLDIALNALIRAGLSLNEFAKRDRRG